MIPRLRAGEELRAGPVADERIYSLTLEATGSEIAAGEALQTRIAARLRRGEKPGV